MGDYEKSGIPAGRYRISIYKEGYGDRLGKPVTVANGGDRYVPLKMTKKNTIMDFFPQSCTYVLGTDPLRYHTVIDSRPQE